MRILGFGTAALLATVFCAPANATNNFTAQQYRAAQQGLSVMKKLNLLTLGNATLSSDVEGMAYVGGDLTGNNAAIGNGGSKPHNFLHDSNYNTLTVGGNLVGGITVNNGIGLNKIGVLIAGNATSVNINNGSTAAVLEVGGTFNAQNFNPNGSKTAKYGISASNLQTQDRTYVKQDTSLKVGSVGDMKAGIANQTALYQADMTDLSSILGALSPNVTLNTSDRNNMKFNFTGATGDYAVLDIAGSLLSTGGFSLETFANANNGKTLIINVSGNSVNFGAHELGDWSNVQQNIIWNFTDASTLSINAAIYGSVLAPKATVTGSQQLNGSIVAQVFNYSGEVHLGTFNGNTGFLVVPPPNNGGGQIGTPGVPEPASWMTMLLGFGFIGSLIRSQRRKERLAAA